MNFSATFPLPPLRALFPAAQHERIFLVGGSVRDLLRGEPVTDLDLAAALSGEDLRRLGFAPVTPKSTTPIFLRSVAGLGKLEVTRLAEPAALAEDLERRDFTANALALGLDGVLHDPLGGYGDVRSGTLRLCTPGALRADPGRIWRALRFASGGWRLAPETATELHHRDWNEELAALPVERFSSELVKALGTSAPPRFFRLMLDFGVGRSVLPELFRMAAVPAGPPEHHPEGDLFTHCSEVLERMCVLEAAPLPRFCAFFHDLGKLATDPALYPRHHGHDEAGFLAAPAFCARLALPAAWLKALSWSCRLHGPANRWGETRDATRIRIAEGALKGGVASFLPQLVAADWPEGPGMVDWPEALQAARLSAAALGLAAEDFVGRSAEDCRALLMQRRVDQLRRARAGGTGL